ncbi:hypothetical protein B0H14DRAFT_2618037 [Mycena olivaceomarginata]|nr:hypothetical protein B0H14DRAFT_2618037 [Mycena olivaceomarginata]
MDDLQQSRFKLLLIDLNKELRQLRFAGRTRMDFESIVQISAFGQNQSDVTAFKLNAHCPPPACRRSRLPANRPPAKVLDALVVQARVPRLAFLCSVAYRASLSASLVRTAGCPPYVLRRRHAEPNARAHTVAVLVHRASIPYAPAPVSPLPTACDLHKCGTGGAPIPDGRDGHSPYGRAVESAQCFAPAQARPEAWHGIFLGESSFWIWVWMATQTRTWGDGNMGWGAAHCLRRISRTMTLTGATSSVKGAHSMG